MSRNLFRTVSLISLLLLPLLSPAARLEIKGVRVLNGDVLKAVLDEERGWRMIIFLGGKPRYTWRVDPSGSRITLDVYGLRVDSKEVGFIPIGSKRLKLIRAVNLGDLPVKARLSLEFNSPFKPAAVRVENTMSSIIISLLPSLPPKAKPTVKPKRERVETQEARIQRKPKETTEQTQYMVGPGDLIEVKTIWDDGDSETEEFIVDGEGQIVHPLLGQVKVADQTVQQIGLFLQEALRKYLRNYRIEVSVKEYRSKSVLVVGEVAQEGEVPWKGPVKLKALLRQAGGWTAKADISRVELYLPGKSRPLIVDLRKSDPLVVPNSVVNVPPK
jgi:protein involved in polysaccharide export with SLBB domain